MLIVMQGSGIGCRGSLAAAARSVTPELVNFMVRHARGVVALALTAERCEQLRLAPMRRRSRTRGRCAMVSIEAREGVTTGISAHDRARTIQVAIDPDSRPDDLVSPGHIFPIRVDRSGTLGATQTPEAAVDLTRLADVEPAAVFCEILDDDGAEAGREALESLARRHSLAIVTVEDVADHRRRHERLVARGATAQLPTPHGDFRAVGYRDLLEGTEHVVLIVGAPDAGTAVPVAVHLQCTIGEAFDSTRCDCAQRLSDSMRRIGQGGSGVILYLGQASPTRHLLERIDTYEWRDELGLGDGAHNDHQHLDERDQILVAQILKDLGVDDPRFLHGAPGAASGTAGSAPA
jgi:3,4-dihydroxy 2-butanone 4-phosphate synthase/GTP cyclohydrolase II